MNKADIAKIVMIIKTAYPAIYKNYTKSDLDAMLALWGSVFELQPFTYEQVSRGLYNYIAQDKAGFPPSCGQVIDSTKEYLKTMEHIEMLKGLGFNDAMIRDELEMSDKVSCFIPSERRIEQK